MTVYGSPVLVMYTLDDFRMIVNTETAYNILVRYLKSLKNKESWKNQLLHRFILST